VQSKIAEIDSEMAKTAGRRREILSAQRNELNAELALAKEIQTTVQNLVTFTGASGSGGGSLAAQIDELERSVPEAAGKNLVPRPPPISSKESASATMFSAESAGVVGLAAELFSIHSRRTRLSDPRKATEALVASIGRLKLPLGNEARSLIQRSDRILSQASSEDPAQLQGAQQHLTELANRFSRLSTAIRAAQ
jgi:hypothetical protein